MSIRKVEKVSGIGSTRCSTGKSRDEGRSFREALRKAAQKTNPNCDRIEFSTSIGRVPKKGDNEREQE